MLRVRRSFGFRAGVSLLAISLFLAGESRAAQYCPFYLSGTMNGVYYYYGPMIVPSVPCGTFFTLPSTEVHSVGLNCTPSTCIDPITTLRLQRQPGGAAVMQVSETKVRLAKYGGKIGRKIKRRQTGDPDGIVKDPTTGTISKDDSFLVSSPDVSIVAGTDKEIFVLDKNNKKKFFRVFDVQLKYAPACDGAGNIFYETKNLLIGQELDVKPSEPQPATEWKWSNTYDDKNHLFFDQAQPARLYFVTSHDDFEHP
jgi:hypothetical protein